ncbi:DUF721 domain-containing protein [Kangiella sp. TOML190]|uniref:DUF721 domain-containing protein n=1 Tax=Kangiella sp. TOML190 TaxID=2931351 RepID=UPI00203CEE44|nr:DciA family protein [Kangiella sp. TOML190]
MKRPFRAKSVADSLDRPIEGHLKQLLDKAKNLKSISSGIEQFLPEELQAHCKVAQINSDVLTLFADSAVWANRLRYLGPELLTQLRANGYPSLVSIDIKIRPNF